jgi:hypothetical protein
MRQSDDRGFASQCSKVAAAPAAGFIGLGTRIQIPLMQEKAFVCPEEDNIRF